LVGRWASGGNYWGGGINWGNRDILGNRPTNPIASAGNRWQHNPAHRQGVRYANANVQQRFGNNNIRSGSQQRMDFRGRNGQQVLSPGGDRANVGDRANTGDRAKATDRTKAGDKAKAGKRADAGNRAAANRPSAERKGTNRSNAANRGAAQQRASAAPRPSARTGGNAFGNIQRGGAANVASQRGRASFGGGARVGGGPRGGGGRRSDAALKHDIVLLGHLDNNLGFYRFSYNGSDRAYVGVIAQEVQAVMPEAVVRGRDGYLRVFYDKLGLKFQTYDHWVASGSRIPARQTPARLSDVPNSTPTDREP
jgi:hypothetical protein